MAAITGSSLSTVYPVRHPHWLLSYAGKNISADVSKMVIEITYTDHESHLSDEIEVQLEDRDKRWQGPWYPSQGDSLNLQIGYADEPLLPCGNFEIDELELDGGAGGDIFHIKGIGAGITPSLRTPLSAGYENQTLLQVAKIIAARHGLSVSGSPAALNLQFARVTQNNETDLAFLHRLANRYNYDFLVRQDPGILRAEPARTGACRLHGHAPQRDEIPFQRADPPYLQGSDRQLPQSANQAINYSERECESCRAE